MEYELDPFDVQVMMQMEDRIYSLKRESRISIEALVNEKNKLLDRLAEKYGIENIHSFYVDLVEGRLKPITTLEKQAARQ